MTARYLKSFGTPSSLRISSMTGNHLVDFFKYKIVELCLYVFTISSLSKLSLTPNPFIGTTSPASSSASGISGDTNTLSSDDWTIEGNVSEETEVTKSKLKAHRAMVVRMAFGMTGKVTVRTSIRVAYTTMVIHIVLVLKTLKETR